MKAKARKSLDPTIRLTAGERREIDRAAAAELAAAAVRAASKATLPDAVIAGGALERGLTVVTGDSDFLALCPQVERVRPS